MVSSFFIEISQEEVINAFILPQLVDVGSGATNAQWRKQATDNAQC